MSVLTKECGARDYSLTPKALSKLRLYSVLALTGFPLFSILEIFNVLDGLGKPLHLIIITVLLISSIPLTGDRIYNRLSRHKGRLDEREREAMGKAQMFSYKFILVSLIASIAIGLTLLGVLGIDFRTPYVTIAGVAMVALNIALITLFLPITYIAWTQKPLPLED